MIISDTNTIDRMVEIAAGQMAAIGRADWIANKSGFLSLKAQSVRYQAVHCILDEWWNDISFQNISPSIDMNHANKVFFLLILGKSAAQSFFKSMDGTGSIIEDYCFDLFDSFPKNKINFCFEDDEYGVNLAQQDKLPEHGIEILAIIGYNK